MMVVIGGGASGLLASILISRKNMKVTLLEKSNKIGKKILASGNGKCNIGNINPALSFYHSNNPQFIEKVLKGYGAKEIMNIFKTIGIEIIEGEDGKLFPISLQASSVLDILEYEAKKFGVEIICNCNIKQILKNNNEFIIKTDDNSIIAKKILLASGSPASPQLGGSHSGFNIASSLGHNIITSLPSLVQLSSTEDFLKDISGVKIYSVVKLYANNNYITQKEGDVLFTNYGISGLAILDISRDVSLELANYSYCELSIDLMPNHTKEVLLKMFLFHVNNNKEIDVWLNGFINKKLIHIILEQSKCKIKESKNLNRKEIIKIIYSIKNFKLSISKTRGFKGAEVAIGGVDTKEVNPITMESKIVKNLYLAGEILDIDGDRGGFNFHFAWVSAMRVGNI